MKAPELNRKQLNILTAVIASPVILILLIAGICKAYDTVVISSLESALKANVEAKAATAKACDASYEALLKHKQANNIKIEGTGNPCSFI